MEAINVAKALTNVRFQDLLALIYAYEKTWYFRILHQGLKNLIKKILTPLQDIKIFLKYMNLAEAYSEPSRPSTMECFWENS